MGVRASPPVDPDAPPSAPPALEDLRSYVRWMKHTHAELTQRRIAELADVHKSAVARLELGRDVTYRTGARVLRALVAYHEQNLVPPTAPVEDVMTSPVESAYSSWTLQRLYDEMASRGFTWMPFRDTNRSYQGLIQREVVEDLVEAHDGGTSVGEIREDVVTVELPQNLPHDLPVEDARHRLKRGPGIRLVERWGQVRGVITWDNLRRVTWEKEGEHAAPPEGEEAPGQRT